MRDPACDFCAEAVGICTECSGCFGGHCQCDPCQHGRRRDQQCVFCVRGFTSLIDAAVQAEPDDIQKSLDWLMSDHTKEYRHERKGTNLMRGLKNPPPSGVGSIKDRPRLQPSRQSSLSCENFLQCIKVNANMLRQ